MQGNILVIEDNHEIAELIAMHLGDEGYRVDLTHRGDEGLERARGGGYDLLILDLMLPGLDGLSICRELRAADALLPILMLTSKASELDRVLGLELGADDYLTKPFSVRELVARVKALLRRVQARADTTPTTSPAIRYAELTIDPQRRYVERGGQAIELTAREFDLLHFFATHPGRVYSRSQLLEQVWGYGHDGYEHTVNSHINRLRAKLEPDPTKPRYVLTVWGVGYKFAEL